MVSQQVGLATDCCLDFLQIINILDNFLTAGKLQAPIFKYIHTIMNIFNKLNKQHRLIRGTKKRILGNKFSQATGSSYWFDFLGDIKVSADIQVSKSIKRFLTELVFLLLKHLIFCFVSKQKIKSWRQSMKHWLLLFCFKD